MPHQSRRRFLATLGTGAASLAAAAMVGAQQPDRSPEVAGASMEGDGYLPVRRDAKPGATPSMSADQRDDLEHLLSCPCPCTLDVFTCRTSMPCGFSPRIHADVQRLVEGGHSADEIIAAFTDTYGERILMAPKREGFNWAGYLAPFAAVAGGGVVVALMLRRWREQTPAARPALADRARAADATPEELARLDAAVRGDDP